MRDQNAFEIKVECHDADSASYDTINSSYQLLHTSIDNATRKKKTLLSALDKVLSLMRELEVKEKAAEEAKAEATTSGLDILAKVDALKHEQQHKKESNDMVHAREVNAQKEVLAKKLEELQLRVSGVLNDEDRCHGLVDELCEEVGKKVTLAISEKESADKRKLEKETLAQEALAFEERQLLKLEKESQRLKQEAINISKLQDFLQKHEFDVDILRGDVSDKYQDINLLRKCLDLPALQPSGLSLSSQTSSSSSTSSLVPSLELQLKTVESNENPKETADEPDPFIVPKPSKMLGELSLSSQTSSSSSTSSLVPSLELQLKTVESNENPKETADEPDPLIVPNPSKMLGFTLAKQSVKENGSSKKIISPVVADATEEGHSLSTKAFVFSAQTFVVPAAATSTAKQNFKIEQPRKIIRKKGKRKIKQ